MSNGSGAASEPGELGSCNNRLPTGTNLEGLSGELNKKRSLGGDLLSREVALRVPLALAGLTTGFGMGPGVPPPLQPPRDLLFRLGLRKSGTRRIGRRSTLISADIFNPVNRSRRKGSDLAIRTLA